MPPFPYHYARQPGLGIAIGKPVPVTLNQADRMISRALRTKRLFPYIPLFHDCRTFFCREKQRALGRSTLPCHLLFKGYW